MYYSLFLDDLRIPKDVNYMEIPLVNWTIARNYKEFVNLIEQNGLPENLSIDCDLSEEHYQMYFWANNPQNITSPGKMEYNKMKEKCGYHCAIWLVNYCLKNNFDLPKYTIHSMNHISKKDVEDLFNLYTSEREKLNNLMVNLKNAN